MQGNQHPLNSQIGLAQNEADPQIALMRQNMLYSMKRRLEALIALGQESLERLQQDAHLESNQENICYIENSWVQLDDTLRLAQNDWAVWEWLSA